MKNVTTILVVAFICCGPPVAKSMEASETNASVSVPSDDEAVDFKNDLIPLFTKLGCNAGKCHGSAIGRGDFKLSLYGGTPQADYDQIVRRVGGRRINLTSPESSLIFMKPSEHVEHGGGTILDGSDENARLLLKWIEQGAKYVERRQLLRVDVEPQRFVASGAGDRTELKVLAHYDDGTIRDVTGLTRFTAEDSTAVAIDADRFTAIGKRRGRHIVIARYSTRVVPIEIVVPVAAVAIDLSAVPRSNFIDDEVVTALAALRLPVSAAADDSTFVRRITLDLTGRLPEYRREEPGRPVNREALIDELLASDEFVDFYALKLARLLRIQSKGDKNTVTTTPAAARAFHDWLAEQLRARVGYDQMARDIVTASGDTARFGPAAFYTAVEDARLQTELATEVFMGSRMKCANCHNHPLDKWTQDDFHGLTAMFAKLTRRDVIRINPIGRNIHPVTGEAALMKLPGGDFLAAGTVDGRGAFAEWLTARDNPYFARAMVNRLWKWLMGRGLVEPVDDFRSTNPATHPELLNKLAADFVQQGYDVRRTLKLIALSATYGRSSMPVEGNEADRRFYSHMARKPLEAEVLADGISDVLGVASKYGDEPLGTRAVELRDGAVPSVTLDMLGRCDRTSSCEGTDSPAGSLARKLHLFNGGLLNDRIGAPGGRLDELIASGRRPMEIVNEFYRVALNRLPNERESALLSELLDNEDPSSEQRAALEDFVWSIVTCREFVTNH